AEVILDDEDRANDFADEAEAKADRIGRKSIFSKRMSVRGFVSYIRLFTSLVRSYAKKEYREIPVGTIIAIVATLIYFVSPIDILPDFIPGFGYVDDAAVVAFCFMNVKSDLDLYRNWLASRKNIREDQE
ncbi:MAG: DUF1232 domain-containing protein, partial [Erysipelotrichaceae bacterium]|nr:DUF1232 domain-containing protein [Erysipelotrichaceae bacterium]